MKVYSFKFNLIENVTRVTKSMGLAMGQARGVSDKLSQVFVSLDTRIHQVGRSFIGLGKSRLGVDRVIDSVAALKRELSGVPAVTRTVMGGLVSVFRSPVAQIGAFFGAGAIASGALSELSKFEKYKAVLTNAFLGDSQAAERVMLDIKDFAATTPYQLDELTNAFVKLNGRGVALTMKQMRSVGDFAAALGTDFGQLTEAILDVNNSERWNEIGIKVATVGNKIQATYKGVSVQAERSERGALSLVEQLVAKAPGVAGTMAGISATTGGMLSNMQDVWASLQLSIGDAFRPLLGVLIPGVTEMLGRITAWFEQNKEVIGVYSLYFVRLFYRIRDFFVNIYSGILAFVENNKRLLHSLGTAVFVVATAYMGFYAVIGLIRGALILYNLIIGISSIVSLGFAGVMSLLNAVLMANPVGFLIGLFVGLVTAVVYAWNNFEGFRRFVMGMWEVMKEYGRIMYDYMISPLLGFGKVLIGAFTMDVGMIQSGLEQGMEAARKVITGKPMVARLAIAYQEGADKAANVGKIDPVGMIMDKVGGALKLPEVPGTKMAKNQGWNESEDSFYKRLNNLVPKAKGADGFGVVDKGMGISGGGSIKHIKIEIGALVKEMTIRTDNMEMGYARIKEEVTRVLLDATNDVNYAN